jgi:hypothetical protein
LSLFLYHLEEVVALDLPLDVFRDIQVWLLDQLGVVDYLGYTILASVAEGHTVGAKVLLIAEEIKLRPILKEPGLFVREIVVRDKE